MINTAEQMGGALGIAILTALELGIYFHQLDDAFAEHGIHPTEPQYDKVRDFVIEAEQRGLNHVPESAARPPGPRRPDRRPAHRRLPDHLRRQLPRSPCSGRSPASSSSAGRTRVAEGPIFSRRSRWIYANTGRTPAITKHPPPPDTP